MPEDFRLEGRLVPRAQPADSPAEGVAVVVPVRNSMRFLPRVIPALMAARDRYGSVDLVFVDNGSDDGSLEYVQSWCGAGVRLLVVRGGSVAAMRNHGARSTQSEYLSFLDSDCEIGEDYFAAGVATLRDRGAAATGHMVTVPANPRWIERAWHNLHYSGKPGYVSYINSGNFFVRRSAFAQVGGFREDLRTGEDAELAQRLIAAGFRLYSDPAVRAIHLDNPQTLRQFFRRSVWHGLGMFGTARRNLLDKPTLMMALHLIATAVGLSFALSPSGFDARSIAILAVLQVVAPGLTVGYRMWSVKRPQNPVPGALLYWLYYWARLYALGLILTGRTWKFQK